MNYSKDLQLVDQYQYIWVCN